MRAQTRGWLAVLLPLVATGSLLAHHSLGNFDTTKAVRVKGTFVQFYEVNPHSFIYLDQKGENGQIKRWAAEGPSVLQLNRRGLGKDLFKPGDVVEVCGYLPKEPIVWQIASADTTASKAGRLLNAETLTLSDGRELNWGDYGVHKCFESGYADQHTK